VSPAQCLSPEAQLDVAGGQTRQFSAAVFKIPAHVAHSRDAIGEIKRHENLCSPCVDMHVPQAGYEELASCIDFLDIVWNLIAQLTYCGDSVIANHYGDILPFWGPRDINDGDMSQN
jgi:hypothetical protein